MPAIFSACHTDILAFAAETSGSRLPENGGEDSASMLPLLLGRDVETRAFTLKSGLSQRMVSGVSFLDWNPAGIPLITSARSSHCDSNPTLPP